MSFHENLKRIRKRNKMTRKEMAAALDIHPNAYGMYETGAREPSLDKLVIIASILHVTTDELLEYVLDEWERVKAILKANKIEVRESKDGTVYISFMAEYKYMPSYEEIDGKKVATGATMARIHHQAEFHSKEDFLEAYRQARREIGFLSEEVFSIVFSRQMYKHLAHLD